MVKKEKKTVKPNIAGHQRVQTAEGWKRKRLLERETEKKKTKSSSK